MPKQTAPENETKEQKFRRLASQRTNKVLDDLRILGNLSNKGIYSYTEEDVKKIFNAIYEQLDLIKARFKSPKKKGFQL